VSHGGRIGRISLATPAGYGAFDSGAETLFGAGGESRAGHALSQAAFPEKILLEPPKLLVEEVVGLVDGQE